LDVAIGEKDYHTETIFPLLLLDCYMLYVGSYDRAILPLQNLSSTSMQWYNRRRGLLPSSMECQQDYSKLSSGWPPCHCITANSFSPLSSLSLFFPSLRTPFLPTSHLPPHSLSSHLPPSHLPPLPSAPSPPLPSPPPPPNLPPHLSPFPPPHLSTSPPPYLPTYTPHHLSTSPPPYLRTSPLSFTRMTGLLLFWVFGRLFNQIHVQKKHIAMLQQVQKVREGYM